MASFKTKTVNVMNAKQTVPLGDVMVLDADRYGHPLRFHLAKIRQTKRRIRVSVLSADQYGHVRSR
jgi:hypothetical protein